MGMIIGKMIQFFTFLVFLFVIGYGLIKLSKIIYKEFSKGEK